MNSKITTVDQYYAQIPPQAEETFWGLHKIIKDFLKKSTEVLSYQMPTFTIDNQKIAAIAAYKKHIGFYPFGKKQITAFAKELSPYKTSPGAVQFPLGEKLPKTLIQKILKDKMRSEIL